MRIVKLMPDYGCFPLWEASPETVGNIDPDTLPLSDDLKSRLASWADRYDATLNEDDPLVSQFPTPEEQQEFEQEGRILAVGPWGGVGTEL